MQQRARSAEDKARRSEELLAAAEAEARARGGVRFVTLAGVTERAGLHRTGVRRYYASKEELLLALAEDGWRRWSASVRERCAAATDRPAPDPPVPGPSPTGPGLSPEEAGLLLADTLAEQPVFCDLLTHVALSLEGDVSTERARAYKTEAFAAHDALVAALEAASGMTTAQLGALVAAALSFAGNFWQVSHPTPTLAALYEEVPEWGHVALDFAPRLRLLLRSTALGLVTTLPDGQG
ncbi:TetR/AcrR family transcriptional regulator [Streptomyces fuscigenes]|uniref:TetR/AcrR family transcriptional regulator n=1 Tax=Streptomyces fuscigenes TaxID=1528880 RepID=UPI001F3E528C|nr:TetR/AcrR family transcriptional regulator [Streptomyces fuscigenes]MCF3962644.1 TetR/AcrR family transcriptional regulator [Streptomyces fuscigenes]